MASHSVIVRMFSGEDRSPVALGSCWERPVWGSGFSPVGRAECLSSLNLLLVSVVPVVPLRFAGGV